MGKEKSAHFYYSLGLFAFTALLGVLAVGFSSLGWLWQSLGTIASLPGERKGEIAPGIVYEKKADILSVKLHQAQELKELLSFSLKTAFLRAKVAKDKVAYHMASFKMGEKVICQTRGMTLEEISHGEKVLLLKGKFLAQRSLGRFKESCNVDYELRLKQDSQESVLLELSVPNSAVNRLELAILSHEKEKFLGMGEQFTHLNLKGHRVPVLTEEQGVGRGAEPITTGANLIAKAGGNAYTTYAPIPFVMSNRGRAFHLLNSEYAVFDFRPSSRLVISVWSNQVSMRIYQGNSYLELLQHFTRDTGRFSPLPDWSYGTILGMQGGRDKVEKELAKALSHGNPVTAIWIQDWVGRRQTSFGSQLWWRWVPDEDSYPNFREWVASLRKRGIRVLGYINPFLANEGEMYEEALKKDLLVKREDGSLYVIQTAGFPAVLLDLTNPSTRTWIKEIIKRNLLGQGLSGWMADFGEWLPWDAKLHSGVPASQYHNLYPVEWARLNREAIREAGKEGDVFVFVRAGFTGSAKYAICFWLGDQLVSFDEYDGLASAITGLITGGLSGLALNHSDIGGYTTIDNPIKNYHRSRYLLYRWIEFESLTPIYRTHEGNRPLRNVQFYTDEESHAYFARFGRLHNALAPYFRIYVEEAAKTGLPVVRALALHFPEKEASYHARHQFLVGEDLLVIPAIEEESDFVEGYFPPGKWAHALEETLVLEGDAHHRVHAPLGRPAVFLRQGGRYEVLLKKIFQDWLAREKDLSKK
ncbi:MAG: alpha-glucosidase [Leptospiraceae bacterium]|nr:alpha-glucosidase [Leptospiraceae bacterium]